MERLQYLYLLTQFVGRSTQGMNFGLDIRKKHRLSVKGRIVDVPKKELYSEVLLCPSRVS